MLRDRTIAAVIASAMPVSTIGVTRASLISCPAISCPAISCPAISCPLWGSSGCIRTSLVRDHLSRRAFRVRIVHRNKRRLSQLPEKRRQPQSPDRHRRHKIGPLYLNALTVERRIHTPVNIPQPHQQHEYRDSQQQRGAALNLALQQQQERHAEMKYDQEHRNRTPSLAEPPQVPGNLIREV